MHSQKRRIARSHAAVAQRSKGIVLGMPWPMALALAASLAILLLHASLYRFLTDDSYISFRYARNLAHGFGLVFNPGYERVEGYSNFLWVMVLAGLDRLGVVPERAANPLSLMMTIALWIVVVAFARRRAPAGREWVVLVPALGLALTRSVAVWSTSGLETRCFELLVVAGLLRLVDELEAIDQHRLSRSVACWLLALAAWTRPDGLLVAGCAFLVAAVWLVRRRADLMGFAVRQLPFAGLVVGHLVFRRLYYGDWLPNTYYAKVGGHLWWSSGFRYLTAFVIEYGLLLWIPLLVAGIAMHRDRRAALFPMLVAGVVLPHVLYITAIGGDHFEFRPFDLYFPLGFLLLQDAVAQLAIDRTRRVVVSAWLLLVGLGLTWIPWASHREFIGYYRPGFPGAEMKNEPEATRYLDPDRDPLLRLPGLRTIASLHRDLTRWMTYHFVAIRQEEHRMFLTTALAEGERLRALRERGFLPADTYIAIDCVGAIPYTSDLRTLDRLGLTDAHVARSPMIRETMAHGKSATLDYARERGVDLWSIDPVHLTLPITSTRMMVAVQDGMVQRKPYYAIDVGEDGYLICQLPRGLAETRKRLPNLNILSFGDSSFIRVFIARGRAAFEESLRVDPSNLRAARNLGYLILLGEDYVTARRHYQIMCRYYPSLMEGFENLALCDDLLGYQQEGMAAARQAMALASQNNDTAAIRRIGDRMASIDPSLGGAGVARHGFAATPGRPGRVRIGK
jgi:arabinofuranosyltransferase